MKEYIIKIGDEPDIMGNYGLKEKPKELVRCKDCKYGEPWGTLIGCGTSKGFGITHNPDWFCADGERREYVKPVTESATDWDGVECE